ncbi:hypothetical protein NL108_012958 [Boleophthalmus pectinirostris]|nr:hypothetical protein NL108_012958 [Boleophthalmus pectinirostris]
MTEQKTERKFKVELRCVGSPFDRTSKAHHGRSRSKTSLVRTVLFSSATGALPKEKEVAKEHKNLETASERAPSPPPMFDRSDRFNDRFSDIYCDRRTGARFSDKFSDRCSDRYSDRFSDTDSLHNEVRTKLTTLQKAVKQRKRLSISTMSSSEFDGESVISEPTYSEYMERIRSKHAALHEAQLSSRLSDSGDGSREIHVQPRSRDSSETRVRHSFEPQSRTRVIQLMKGELLPQAEKKEGEMEHTYRSFIQSKEDMDFKVMSSVRHHEASAQITTVEVPYSENVTSQAQLLPTYITSSQNVNLTQTGTTNVEMAARTTFGEQEKMRAQYGEALEVERMEHGDKLLAQRITKWQQGERMSEDERFHSETDLPLPAEPPYMEPEGIIQQKVVEKKESGLTEAVYHHKSPRMIRSGDNETSTATHPRSPKINVRPEDPEFELPVLQSQLPSRTTEVAESPSRTRARAEARMRDSPRLRLAKKDHFVGEGVISQEITEQKDVYEEEYTSESLRAHYEKELEAERLECEEKLLALRIRKWQQGMIISEEDNFHPETDLPMPADAPYMEPEGQVYAQEEMVKKEQVKATENVPTPTFHKSPKMKTRAEEFESEVSVKQLPKSPRVKSRISEQTIQASPRARARQERFEKMKHHEMQLSRENISELSDSAQFGSEEEALNERIMKWQQDVYMEQQGTVKLEPGWAESCPTFQTEAEAGRGVHEPTEATKAEAIQRKMTTSENVAISREVPFQNLGDTPEWPSTELPTEGRETRLEKDSEYLVSEQEAMAQRILKWQKDEVTELESEWPVDPQGKQLFEVTERIHSVTLPDTVSSQFPSVPYEKQLQTEMSSPTFQTSYGAGLHQDVKAAVSLEALQAGRPDAISRQFPSLPYEKQFQPEASSTTLQTSYGAGVHQDVKATPSNEVLQATGPNIVSSQVPSLPYRKQIQTEASLITSQTSYGAGVYQDVKATPETVPTTQPLLSMSHLSSASGIADQSTNQESLLVQKHAPTHPLHTMPPEEMQYAAPAKPFRQSFPTAKEAEPQSEEYTMLVDKASLQRFQYEVKEEGRMKEEVEQSREVAHRRLLKDNASELEVSAGVKESGGTDIKTDTKINISLKENVQPTESNAVSGKPSINGKAPVFVKELSPLKASIGEMSEFCCQFRGEPIPTVNWIKDGQPLAYDPDYDIITKSNYSKLTVFYPTTDHVGTYECILTNKYGKVISTATLEVSEEKVMRAFADKQEVIVTHEVDETTEKLERNVDNEVVSYTETGKATLQVPQVVIQKQRLSDDSFSSSPVEIRIIAATPVPEMAENASQAVSPAEKPSEVPTDDSTSQIKHKFTFSFDVAPEAPNVVHDLENITCSEGNTAFLERAISGEPTPEVSYTADVSFQAAKPGQFSSESETIHDKEKRATGLSEGIAVVGTATISHTDAVKSEEKTQHLPLETSRMAQKSRSALSRESQGLSGCGLASSAAVINVSQIKQTFESDSQIGSMASPSSDEQTKETLFPKEFIPEVLEFSDQQKQIIMPEPGPVGEGIHTVSEENIPLPLTSFEKSAEPTRLDIHGPQQFVEKLQDSPDLVRPKAQKPGVLTEQIETGVAEMSEDIVRPFERTSSFIPFQPDKVPTSKSVKTSTSSGEALSSKGTEPIKPERQKLSATSLKHSKAVDEDAEIPASLESNLGEVDVKGITQVREELEYQSIQASEPSLDSGVFLSLPESQVDVTETMEVLGQEIPSDTTEEHIISPAAPSHTKHIEEGMTSLVESLHKKHKEDDLSLTTKVGTSSSVKDKGIGIEEKIEGVGGNPKHKEGSMIEGSTEIATIVEAGKVDNTLRGTEELEEGEVDNSLRRTEELDIAQSTEEGTAATTSQSMQEEEVSFGAVYDYYNPPTDWGRPLSPESEMSIEIGSTMSEEIAEVAERFFTPGSSTETSQQIADSFQSSKSPMSLNTPTSDSPGGFMTPQEYGSSPLGYKRPSTGSSIDNFFSPVQYLQSPADETSQPEITLEETRFLSGRSSLGLGSLQEKVQGIPPAFLKPLIKKKVFENDTLMFYAEVFGLPSPEIKWFCNKNELEESSRIKMDRDGDSISLTICNVTKADQGEYICEAINYVGEARSVALVVVMSQEIKFMPAPPAVTHQHVMEFDVEEDDSSRSPSPQEILLEVELDEKDVKEFEKQVKIITIPEYTADNKSMIISLDVLPSIYEEGAVDFVTQEHDDLKIAFEVTEMPPRFINPICDMEAHEGTTVMFECSLMGIPSPIVSWFKGAKKIPHNKKFILSSDGDNHFLKICKITSQDSGVYTCRAINVVGETLCRASLVVLSAKAFVGKTRGRELTAVSLGSAKVEPQKFDLMVGNTSFDGEQVSEIELEFEFEQEADESQRAVRLVANTDKETSEQGEKYVSINFDVFAEPAKDEKIEFKGKSSEMCSFHFQITETAPKCVIPLTNVTAAVGTPVILQCLVSGKPNPTAEWYKDGELVTDSRCIIQEKTAGHFNLLITNVTQSDAGEYKCLIQNSSGSIETTALLKVF